MFSVVLQSLKVIKKLIEHFPIKRAPLSVRFTAPKPNFAGLMEKVAEWNATVVSKDESGAQPSIVSISSSSFWLFLCHTILISSS